MEVKVDLEPSKVNDAIAAAVVQSRLGEAVKESIEKFLNDKHWDKPNLSGAMENAVANEVKKITMEIVSTECREKILAAVQLRMTDEVLDKIIDRLIDKLKWD